MYSSSTDAGRGTDPDEALDIIAGRPNVMEITLRVLARIFPKQDVPTYPSTRIHAISYVLIAVLENSEDEQVFVAGVIPNSGHYE